MRCVVIGNHSIDDVEPGGLVELDNPGPLVRAGHVWPVKSTKAATPLSPKEALAAIDRSEARR